MAEWEQQGPVYSPELLLGATLLQCSVWGSFALFGVWVGYLTRSTLRSKAFALVGALFLILPLAAGLAVFLSFPLRLNGWGVGLIFFSLSLWVGHIFKQGLRPTGLAAAIIVPCGLTGAVVFSDLQPASSPIPLQISLSVSFAVSGAVAGSLGFTLAFLKPPARVEIFEEPTCIFCHGPISDQMLGSPCDLCARASHYECRTSSNPAEGLVNCPQCGSIPEINLPPAQIVSDTLWLCPRVNSPGTARWRKLAHPPRYGLVRYLLSWPLTVAVIIAALAVSIGFIQIARKIRVGDATGIVGGTVISYGLLKIGLIARRLRAPSALRKVRRDRRAPILFLRAFGDDQLPVAPSENRAVLWAMNAPAPPTTFEEVLCDHFADCGPVVAIGRPGENLPPLGAARFWVSDAHWQSAVEILLSECQFIIMVLGRVHEHPGLAWEAEKVFNMASPDRAVLIVPPLAEEEVELRWEAYRKLSGGRIPAHQGGELAMTFDTEGRCLVAAHSGPFQRSAAAYKAALRFES